MSAAAVWGIVLTSTMFYLFMVWLTMYVGYYIRTKYYSGHSEYCIDDVWCTFFTIPNDGGQYMAGLFWCVFWPCVALGYAWYGAKKLIKRAVKTTGAKFSDSFITPSAAATARVNREKESA